MGAASAHPLEGIHDRFYLVYNDHSNCPLTDYEHYQLARAVLNEAGVDGEAQFSIVTLPINMPRLYRWDLPERFKELVKPGP